MNYEKTDFFVINTKDLWENRGTANNIAVTPGGISLAEVPAYDYGDSFAVGFIPQSLGLDPCGSLFVLGTAAEEPTGASPSVYLFYPDDPTPRELHLLHVSEPRCLTVSGTNIYIVHGEKITCFDRAGCQIRWQKTIETLNPENIKIASVDEHQLYVMHIHHNDIKLYKTGREWQLDEKTRIILRDRKQGNTGAPYPFKNVLGISSDGDGNIYILEETEPGAQPVYKILRFSPNGEFTGKSSIPFKEKSGFLNLAVNYNRDVYLGFEYNDAERSRTERGIVRLKHAKRYANSGTYTTEPLDSTIPGCVWHKVVLETGDHIPKNTQIILSYNAGENKSDLETGRSFPYRRVVLNHALVIDAVGRYFQARLELKSDETTGKTPVLESLKIYFPERSYLRYLPAVYQENKQSKEFLQRFLSLFETLFSRTEETLLNFSQYLDINGTPDPFVPWLFSWLAVAYDENWPVEKKRRLLGEAPRLYKMRGTRRGLRRLIEIYCGTKPLIVERIHFNCREGSENEYIEMLIKMLIKFFCCDPGGKKTLDDFSECGLHSFCVLLAPITEEIQGKGKRMRAATETEQQTVQRIIDTEKPAHTTYRVQVLEPWFYLDRHTYLGVNTLLSKRRFILGKTSALGRDSVLRERVLSGRLEKKSRIGLDLALT